MIRVALCVPTYNGGELWEKAARCYHSAESLFIRRIVVDSGSSDKTIESAKSYGFEVTTIEKSNFNHGGTRQTMVNMIGDDADIVLFATQDAIPISTKDIEKLIDIFA